MSTYCQNSTQTSKLKGTLINDKHLEDTLRKLAGDNLRLTEMSDYMQPDFPEYAWSLRTLDRRLRYSNIYKTGKNVTIEEVQRVVLNETSGPGHLLGYRPMHVKIRQYHQLNVPRKRRRRNAFLKTKQFVLVFILDDTFVLDILNK